MADAVPDDEVVRVLAGVGPRLRARRVARALTLARLSRATGISVSTLSRLESGGRKATLDLLLPLAKAYGTTLDDLVGAPPTGDPRVHLRPVTRHGSTYIPLARAGGGPRAYKQILPPARPDRPPPEQRVHAGHEWLYLLTGRLRLRLGDRELVLTSGEAAEFSTRIPHAVTNVGGCPAEILNLFGPDNERPRLRHPPGP